MSRYLIVANQTLGGAELDQKVRDRVQSGEGRFFVVVPMIEPEFEVTTWAPHDPMFGVPVVTREVSGDAVEEARARSEHRLGAMIDRITALGGDAQGEVGDPDPAVAVESVLDRERFDEVIVSTLPSGLSRWLKLDLPSRIERMTDCPVTTVEAQETEGG